MGAQKVLRAHDVFRLSSGVCAAVRRLRHPVPAPAAVIRQVTDCRPSPRRRPSSHSLRSRGRNRGLSERRPAHCRGPHKGGATPAPAGIEPPPSSRCGDHRLLIILASAKLIDGNAARLCRRCLLTDPPCCSSPGFSRYWPMPSSPTATSGGSAHRRLLQHGPHKALPYAFPPNGGF